VTPFALTCGTQFLAPSADIYQYGSLGYVAQARGPRRLKLPSAALAQRGAPSRLPGPG